MTPKALWDAFRRMCPVQVTGADIKTCEDCFYAGMESAFKVMDAISTTQGLTPEQQKHRRSVFREQLKHLAVGQYFPGGAGRN